MTELKLYLETPQSRIPHLGTQIFMALSWLIIGGLVLLVYRDTFFLVSFSLISICWLGLAWWHTHKQPKFFVALNPNGITIKTSHLSEIEFFWRDLSFIRVEVSAMTLRLKSGDEYDIGLDRLSAEQRQQWKEALNDAATKHGVEIKL
ncbi:MAG: hypothetical protein CMR00_01385 [[Chlorobium] sp. 445]|nr:MAG: hypothetical protein CMR00_01385 [[Chlorobium] sp. 445]